MSIIQSNIFKIKQQIAELSSHTSLIAVSKHRTSDEIIEAINSGQQIFGENRVQETLSKWPMIKQQYPDVKIHLIGPLQTNKVKEAVSIFDVIEVVDRAKLCKALAKEMLLQNKTLDCLIQVNTGIEPQKAGIEPENTSAFIKYCAAEGLIIKGLMCIPPANEPPKKHFRILQNLAQENNLPVLSMGMSNDYIQAVKCGATHIRVGTAIFGVR